MSGDTSPIILQQEASQFDSFLSGLGGNFSDMNNLASDQLNEDFQLENMLPYGRFVSDILGFGASFCSFEAACRGGEDILSNHAPAPIRHLPMNPFTGRAHDKESLLEVINILTDESEEENHRVAYEVLAREHRCDFTPQEFLRRVGLFNRNVEALLSSVDERRYKPRAVRNVVPIAGSRAARRALKAKDEGVLEILLSEVSVGQSTTH